MSDLFSTEAENSLLAILLQHPDQLYNLQAVKFFMFSSVPNQTIFSAIDDLASQGLVPDLQLVESYLKSKSKDLNAGGKEYLEFLYRLNCSPENLKEYEKIVVDSYKARVLISLSSELSSKITGSDEVDRVIFEVRNVLDNLSFNGSGDLTSDINQILHYTWEDLVERAKNPGIRGITTGIKDLDIVTSGINKGDLWFIAGRPGMGKTAQMCNMILNQAKQGIPTLMFSFEMNKQQLAERLICIETRIPSNNLRLGLLDEVQMNKISEAIKTIKDLPIFIDSNFSADLYYVLTTIRKYKRSHDIKVVYLDYIQLLSNRNADSTNELGRISRGLKLLSNELEIGCIIGSQLNRNSEARDNKRPQISDLRQSGNLEEDADIVIGLYRDVIYNPNTKDKALLENILLKHRNGSRGMLPLKFIEEYGVIESYDGKQ